MCIFYVGYLDPTLVKFSVAGRDKLLYVYEHTICTGLCICIYYMCYMYLIVYIYVYFIFVLYVSYMWDTLTPLSANLV
jgi:hypothetical protein